MTLDRNLGDGLDGGPSALDETYQNQDGSLSPFGCDPLPVSQPSVANASVDWVRFLQILHAGPDGWVTFHRMCGDWTEVGAWPINNLNTFPPRARRFLDTDAYASINTMYRAGTQWKDEPAFDIVDGRIIMRDVSGATGLFWAVRNSASIKWLNACCVDIDVGRDGSNIVETISAVQRVIDSHGIAPPAIRLYSGRGMWLFWLLRGETVSDRPAQGFRRLCDQYSRIQRRLIELFIGLGADPQVTDVARCVRLPGSINSKSGQRVGFECLSTEHGELPRYTMAELASSVDLQLVRPPRRPGRAVNAERAARARASRWMRDLDRFEKLRRLRGLFVKGVRRKAALVYAYLLTRRGFEAWEIEERVLQLAAECNPPLPASEARQQIRSAAKLRFQLRHDTIFKEWLRTSDEELAAIGIGKRSRTPRTTATRLAAIVKIRQEHPTLSVSEIVSRLRAEGLKAAPRTVYNDLQKLRQ